MSPHEASHHSSATNFPQLIDTQSCLCGLLDSREASRNGNQRQVWRCIGEASEDIGDGDHGKWYNTTLPSEEYSGINQPQNWGGNPPDTSKFYVLVESNGRDQYETPRTDDPPQLVGADKSCTGKNDTGASTEFYRNGKVGGGGHDNNDDHHTNDDHDDHESNDDHHSSTTASTKASSKPASAASTPSSSSTSASSVSSAAAATTSAPASSSTSSSPSTASTSSADKPRPSLKSMIMLTFLVAPLLSAMFQT